MKNGKKFNKLMNFQYEFSCKMVNNIKDNTLIIEDLKVKEMAQSKKRKKGILKIYQLRIKVIFPISSNFYL